MSPLIRELEQQLKTLDPETTRLLEQVVRDTLALAKARSKTNGAVTLGPDGRPVDYFERTAGALAGEPFERPDQGQLPPTKEW